ncbi:aminotransferase class I/II-fold pyridoxal phosphate-dependent enzyme [Deinococcus radiopugnans]|uniref:aminotransferase class I/II-fold pyridoxal phosphate-dependent enzyme n=1 Tax=Deinococcus radiopugnans TaxID=57497 RepID=UPI00361C608B
MRACGSRARSARPPPAGGGGGGPARRPRGGYYEGLRAEYRARQDLLAEGLRGLGATVFLPQGTYFLTAIHPEWRAETLVQRGVAVIPGEAFYAQHPAPEGLLRVAFCKSRDEIAQALERLSVVATTPV